MIRWMMLAACAAAALLAVIPAVRASKSGADPGFSGGFVSTGNDCTACHPFNSGVGYVELLGLPERYQSDAVYDLTVRVGDPLPAGAGFEVSAEGDLGHAGTLLIMDPILTQYTFQDAGYVTHTYAGVEDSIDQWAANGNAYEYRLRWQAPAADEGPITFFTAANAVDENIFFAGVRFYAAHDTIGFARPADADGDGDVDLRDFQIYQRCFNGHDPMTGDRCVYVDTDTADFLASFEGPTAPLPAGYVLADSARGGALYDRWWGVSGAPAPTGTHPLYPLTGQQTGRSTFRCKECHGWDYKGRDGAYGEGVHYTDIRGVFGTSLEAQEIFDLLKTDFDPVEAPAGHGMTAFGMSDADIWDVVRFTLEGVVDTDLYIDANAEFIPEPAAGLNLYVNEVCASCHGSDGRAINFGSADDPEYVGDLARSNPWEFLHKVRYGAPGSPMPAFEALRWDAQTAAEVSAYAASLP